MELNKPVDFTTAKLLKEKGFDKPCCSRYWVGYEKEEHLQIECLSNNYNDYDDDSTIYYSAPTIAEVVMWLYEKHGIWIRVTPIPYSNNLTHWRWEHMSSNYATRNMGWKKEQDYLSPTEAYEVAIEYCLTKLI